MHAEYYEISQEAADAINSTKARGKRVIAVGTTSTRTLETVADESGHIRPAVAGPIFLSIPDTSSKP